MAIVYDYADIASRMLGELKPKPKPPEKIHVVELKTELPGQRWRMLNPMLDEEVPF